MASSDASPIVIDFLYSDPHYTDPPVHVQRQWRLYCGRTESIREYIESMIDHLTDSKGMQKHACLVTNSFGMRMVVYKNHPDGNELGSDAAFFVNKMCAKGHAALFNF